MRVRSGAGVLTRVGGEAGGALIRFWFPVEGHFGIGVTADSLAEATELATAVAVARGWTLDARLVEQNVDVRTLDRERVQPGLGALDRPGVWFPR